MDVTTRIEEENQVEEAENMPEQLSPIFSDIDSTDDELEELGEFNIDSAQTEIFELPGCHKISLKFKVQKQLGLEVGINVSDEFPWKRIKFSLLSQHLFDEIDNGEALQEFFTNYKPSDEVLLGYAPSLIPQDEEPVPGEDPFVIYVTEDDARAAAEIIKNMEIHQRSVLNKMLIKKPRKWESKGSEYEVNLGIPLQKSDVADVEIQTVYPMKQSDVKFTMRRTSDVRDGYAELVPGDAIFHNVIQKTVNVGVQSAPAMVTLEQQTDPTFPSNAWAQYLYEIKEEDKDGLDESSEEEQEKGKSAATSKTVTPSTEVEIEAKPAPEMSDQINYLLSVLEFNQIDMYRNDYPKIASAPIRIFTKPYLQEIFCFAYLQKTCGRYVSAVDWFPHLTGIVVASYSYTTKVTDESVKSTDQVDKVRRTILQPNPILMWSFTDSLNYKLEFESPREVTALSFCPYDKNILIGGTINGQIIIWDLQDRTEYLELGERLTIEEGENREFIAQFLAWTIQYDEAKWVFPAAISALSGSQTDAITDIKWLSRNFYISSNGRIHETSIKGKSRCFVTLSTDGSVAYWDLDFEVRGKASSTAKKPLPPALTQNESVYKVLDKLIKPIFTVTYPEPLTSFICDVANYSFSPQVEGAQFIENGDRETFPVIVEEADEGTCRNSFIVGSFFGRIECLTFEGSDSGSEVNKENIITPMYSFARVHDGPIVGLEKNPFYPEIFVSIGRTIMAIWQEDFPLTPILWRVRPITLTGVKWSTDRPAVLFLTLSDGNFEAWDLLARDDDACLTEVLGGGIITSLSEHRAAVPEKVVGIGDYNSSFHMVAIPEGFYKQIPNELELLRAFVEKEVHRKKSIQSWQENWRTKNSDIIEENKKARVAAAKDLERLRLEAENARKAKETPETTRAQSAKKSAAHYDFEEKLDQKWDELNLKRLMRNLMARKMFDPEKLERETALEKDRLRYEERKKASINEALSKASEEIAAVRARLLPVEKEEIQLSDIISGRVKKILEVAPSYEEVESESQTFLNEAPPVEDVPYKEIVRRYRDRRRILNKVLGQPCSRAEFCEREKKSGNLKNWDLGYGEFLISLEEAKKSRAVATASVAKPSHSDVDKMSQKDLNV